MKEFFLGLVVGAALTAATGWYFVSARKTPLVQQAQDTTAATLRHAADVIEAKLTSGHLTSGDIEAELARSGRGGRRQMGEVGAALADAASDSKITATLKAKFALDRELSALGISVSTTDGRVTLSGKVSSHKLSVKAMMLTRETDGVREVNSTLQVASR